MVMAGRSSLNVIISSTLQKMGYDYASLLKPTDTPFYGIVSGTTAMPLGQITLPVTFGTTDNYRTEYIKFEVVDFDTSYHAIFGCPKLAKFMVIPHYVYLMLKMPPRMEFSLFMVTSSVPSTTTRRSSSLRLLPWYLQCNERFFRFPRNDIKKSSRSLKRTRAQSR
jgi:hypothetical protein